MTSDKDTSERDELTEKYLIWPYIFLGDEVVKITRAFHAGWSARDAEVARLLAALEKIASTRCAWQLSQEIANNALNRKESND